MIVSSRIIWSEACRSWTAPMSTQMWRQECPGSHTCPPSWTSCCPPPHGLQHVPPEILAPGGMGGGACPPGGLGLISYPQRTTSRLLRLSSFPPPCHGSVSVTGAWIYDTHSARRPTPKASLGTANTALLWEAGRFPPPGVLSGERDLHLTGLNTSPGAGLLPRRPVLPSLGRDGHSSRSPRGPVPWGLLPDQSSPPFSCCQVDSHTVL